jgi:formamidopyrimidine-DNA glycosylase
MPELPEVQTTVSGLDRKIRGLKVVDVWTDYNSPFHAGKDSIKNPLFFARFKKEVTSAKIMRVTRRAKNILIHIDKGGKKSVVLVHMKMTGHILYGRFVFDKKKGAAKALNPWTPAPDENAAFHDPFNKFIHFAITFSNGKNLALSDMRKFAKVTLIPEAHLEEGVEQSEHVAGIGPEPLDESFTFDLFKNRIARLPNGRIKTVMMNQEVIAGVGNIYSDEALWRVGINPEERVKKIPDPLLQKLYAATLTVLRKGIDFGGDSMSDYRNIDGERGKFQEQHNAYRKTGQRCAKPGCRGIITRKIVGGRSAHFCSVHQRLLKSAI